MNNAGKFVVFEGIDGSGKTTQLNMLAQRLEGRKLHITKEPTDGEIGLLLRQFLTGQKYADEKALAALFLADRLDHLLSPEYGIKSKIKSGTTVICDRYYLSSYAYHGSAMPIEWVISANSICTGILRPDCIVFIDVSPETAVKRITRRDAGVELFESQERLSRVRDKYFEAIELVKNDENIIIVDGGRDEISLSEAIWQALQQADVF
ncbi:MAG: dTMP kinase [Oscillospiraceae bacterium]|nr:dTMP kinase [Oscillospiraceae bacterium]